MNNLNLRFLSKFILLLFLGTLSFQGFSTSCTVSTAVSASTTPCTSSPVDTIFVTGSITMDVNLTYGFDVVMVLDGGTLNWTQNVSLNFTTLSKLTLVNGGSLITTGTGSASCNSLKDIFFGTVSLISCNGGGTSLYSFADVNNAGGADVVGPLPVTLIDFTGKRLKSNDVQLQWKTAQEINNSHFELESYSNGSFEKIATIPGNGNSNVLLDYSFTHINPKEGMLFYRLKQVDFDGKFEYFKIISISNIAKVKQQVVVFPNPVLKGNHIELEAGKETNYKFRVITYNGEEVLTGINYGEKSILETQSIPEGIYIIEFTFSNNMKIYEKVIIL